MAPGIQLDGRESSTSAEQTNTWRATVKQIAANTTGLQTSRQTQFKQLSATHTTHSTNYNVHLTAIKHHVSKKTASVIL